MDFETHNMQSEKNDAAKKILMTLVGILLVYITVYVGALIRNTLTAHAYIGQAEQQQRTITVDGRAKVSVVPDVASIVLGMQVNKPTVEEAQTENTAVMNTLIEGLKERGIEEKDIQTQHYNVSQWYTYTNGTREEDGYQVSQNVKVTIRDIESADDILGFAGTVGANSIGGLTYEIDDTSTSEQQAREEAITDAFEKADRLAKTLGLRLTQVVGYNEYTGGGYPTPMYARSYADEAVGYGGAAPQVEAGSENVVMNVSVTFEIR